MVEGWDDESIFKMNEYIWRLYASVTTYCNEKFQFLFKKWILYFLVLYDLSGRGYPSIYSSDIHMFVILSNNNVENIAKSFWLVFILLFNTCKWENFSRHHMLNITRPLYIFFVFNAWKFQCISYTNDHDANNYYFHIFFNKTCQHEV